MPFEHEIYNHNLEMFCQPMPIHNPYVPLEMHRPVLPPSLPKYFEPFDSSSRWQLDNPRYDRYGLLKDDFKKIW